MGAEFGQGRVERFLPAAEDEDECAVLDEAFCRRDADAGGAAGNHGGFSVEFVGGHFMVPSMGKSVLVEQWFVLRAEHDPAVTATRRLRFLLEQVLENQRAPGLAPGLHQSSAFAELPELHGRACSEERREGKKGVRKEKY